MNKLAKEWKFFIIAMALAVAALVAVVLTAFIPYARNGIVSKALLRLGITLSVLFLAAASTCFVFSVRRKTL